MQTNDQDPVKHPADDALSRRLAQLRALPVDTTRLERMLEAQIPKPRTQTRRWLRSLRAVAAAVIIIGAIVAALVATSGGPVLASAAQMAQVHEDMISNRIPVTKVDSIEEASRMLNDATSQAPGLPQAPDAHVMACCMKSIKDKKVACVLLRSEGVPITMSVARAEDMKLPSSEGMMKDGVRYYVQSYAALNMVSAQRQGRWVCLIGQVSSDRLIELAAKLQF